MPDQVISIPFFVSCSDLALLVMVVDKHLLRVYVELGPLDLVRGWKIGVECKFLGHFIDEDLFSVVVLFQAQGMLVELCIRCESDRAVNEFIWSVFVLFDDLVFLIEEFLSQDEAILLSVVVIVDFAVPTIDAYHLLPMIVYKRALVVLNKLKFIRKTSSND